MSKVNLPGAWFAWLLLVTCVFVLGTTAWGAISLLAAG